MICLECGYDAGIGEQAATYVPAQWRPHPGALPAFGYFDEVGRPGRHSVDAATAQIPRLRAIQGLQRQGAEAPGSGYLPGTPAPSAEDIASAA